MDYVIDLMKKKKKVKIIKVELIIPPQIGASPLINLKKLIQLSFIEEIKHK